MIPSIIHCARRTTPRRVVQSTTRAKIGDRDLRRLFQRVQGERRPVSFAETGTARGRMSLYYVQKLLYQLNRDPELRRRFAADAEPVLAAYELTTEERDAINQADIGLLYVLGVNGQLLMHYAALRGFEWAAYLDAMREGVRRHGPVRAGVYAMVQD
jgi:Aromatic-ring-opening dioxygenase LigAB, LigA subunit